MEVIFEEISELKYLDSYLYSYLYWFRSLELCKNLALENLVEQMRILASQKSNKTTVKIKDLCLRS